jgi:hypothetical protein
VPNQPMISRLLRLFRPLASLKLTIVCLACALVLILVGTLAQVDLGIYEAQSRYFKSFFLYYQLPGTDVRVPWFPGGYLLGIVLLVNLIAAHAARFKFTAKKSGILILHSGLILLLIGQLLTSLFQVESQMRLDQKETKNFSESLYHDELAVVDTSDPGHDTVVSVPTDRLHRGQTIQLQHDSLSVKVDEFYPNAALINPNQLPTPEYPHLTLGPMAVAVPIPKTYKQDERNQPGASVKIVQNSQTVGSVNLSAAFPQPAKVQAGGKTYEITLRPKRYYEPFFVRLDEFRHDRYPGTEIARNFSSRVNLIDPANHENRESLIYMNHPLRYRGLTFYQAGFDNNDQTTVLQVVKNPSWILPYISCFLLVSGMTVQFGMHLVSFLRRRVIA